MTFTKLAAYSVPVIVVKSNFGNLGYTFWQFDGINPYIHPWGTPLLDALYLSALEMIQIRPTLLSVRKTSADSRRRVKIVHILIFRPS